MADDAAGAIPRPWTKLEGEEKTRRWRRRRAEADVYDDDGRRLEEDNLGRRVGAS